MRRPAVDERARESVGEANPGSLLEEDGIGFEDVMAKGGGKRKPASPRRQLELAIANTKMLLDLDKADRMQGRHFVGYYALLHTSVYRVPPLELAAGNAYKAAVGGAQKMLTNDFKRDPFEMVKFFQWVWRRERAKVARRRKEQEEIRRIGWALMFMRRDLLVDYRANQQGAP